MMLLTYKLWIQLLFTTVFYKECHSHNSQKSLRNPSTLYIPLEQDCFDPPKAQRLPGTSDDMKEDGFITRDPQPWRRGGVIMLVSNLV